MIRGLPLLLLSLLAGCASPRRPAAAEARSDAAPAARLGVELRLQLPIAGGGAGNLEAFRGRPVVVVFFATWSERAAAILPQLQQLASDAALQVVGVALDEDRRFVAPFLERHAITFPVLVDAGGVESERALPLRVLPTVAVLDAEGRVAQLNEELRRGALKRIAARARELGDSVDAR